MPIVPTYGPRRVTTAPLPGVRKQAHETALSEGAGLAGAEAQRSEAMGNFGGVAANVGAQMWEQERRRADETVALEIDNKFARFENDRVYNPETGILTVKGKNAMGLAGQVGQDFDKAAGEIEQGLTNDRQRSVFRRIKAKRAISLDAILKRHTFEQMQEFEQTELKATKANAVDAAIVNAGDPRRVGEELVRGVTAIKTHAPRGGMGPEAVRAEVEGFQSALHVGVIDRLLTDDQDQKARAYLEESRDHIRGADLVTVERKVDTASTAGNGLRAATEIWTQHGPKGDQDPIALDVMEDTARTRFANDTKTLDATVKYLRERKQAVDASRQDRTEATAGALWQRVNSGASLAQIQQSPEYLAAPGHLQTQISEHVLSRNEAAMDRGIRQQTRKEHELETAGWSRYWEYSSDPERLAKMSDNAILALTPEIGIEHVNRLMTAKRSIAKSDDTVRDAKLDADLFNTVADAAGLKPYDRLQFSTQKARLGQLRAAIERDIAVEQQAKKRTLTYEEKQTIAQRNVDRRVMTDVWGTDPSRPAAAVIQSEQKAAYVPIADIAQQSLNDWVNLIRSEFPSAQRLSRADVLSQYRDRIQRAHAAHVLGLGADEERRRLQGR